jgi:phosphate transport system substrate-binding protein
MKFMATISLTALLVGCSRDTPQQSAANGTPSTNSTGRTVIQNKGSDTLVNVAQAWAEAYKEVGISSMINGTVDLASSSREMKASELEQARANNVEPIEHIVGYDALAIFLHHDNPIKELTISQLAGIYGENGTLDKWSQLGVTVPGCDSDEIIRISRQNNSGTYAYFKEAILGDNGEYKLGSRDMHGSKDVVDLVEKTPCAIGYSGLAYKTEHISMPCVRSTDDGACVAPSVDTAVDRSYPIARPLFMYTAGQPTGALKTYLDWILSDVGQCIILDKGYAPAKPVTCN